MIAERIRAYLDSDQRREDVTALNYATSRFAARLAGQFMLPKQEHGGSLHTTGISHPCGVRAWNKYHDEPETDPMLARVKINFFVGDAVELAVLTLAQLAGAAIMDTQRELSLPVAEIEDSIAVHPDGRIAAAGNDYGDFEGKDLNVEVKKVSAYGFERAQEEGMDDAFGYLTQATIEVAAWNAAGIPVEATEFVLISANTGHIQSLIARPDEGLLAAAIQRAFEAKQDRRPNRAAMFDPQPETRYDRSLKGKVPTGRAVIGLQCSYCGFKGSCHPGAVMEIRNGGEPTWVVS